VKAKLGDTLLVPHSEFLHSLKKRVSRTVSQKRGKSMTVIESIDPTKPSQLATVAPWEKEFVSEVWEDPWKQEAELIEEYDTTPPFNRNYEDLVNRVNKIFNEQWKAKQRVLKLTKHRLDGYPNKREDPQHMKLNWIREYLTKIGTMSQVPRCAETDLDPITTFGAEKFTDSEGYTTSFENAYRSSKLIATYPQAEKLFSDWASWKDAQVSLSDA